MGIVLVNILLPAAALCLDNGVGRRPPLGFSTWNTFAGQVSDELLRDVADKMVTEGLRDAGYVYINLDDGWAVGRNTDGEIQADLKLFPNGIKSVADYVHSKGLKFGIYTARGSRTCMGRPGSDSHEEQDAATYAKWGVDYLKEDSCGGTVHGTVWEQYSRMRDALNKTGRPIYYSITQGIPFEDAHPSMHCYGSNVFTVKPWLSQGLDPRELANSYLVEYCNNIDKFGYTGGIPQAGGFLSNLDSQALLTYPNLTAPGAYNDPDMLEVCHGSQSWGEYRAQFSTWSILTAPLILGNDVRNMSPECKEIVLNKEVLAINQDANVVAGRLVWQWPDSAWRNETQISRAFYGSNVPEITATLAITACNNRNISQSWLYNHTDSTIRPSKDPSLCLTYSGYQYSNVGLASCQGWRAYNVGSQFWDARIEGDGTLRPINLSSICLSPLQCQNGAAVGMADCDPSEVAVARSSLKAPPACDDADKWKFVDLGEGGFLLASANTQKWCAELAPAPHSSTNITLQIWVKPLQNGDVAALAFNRGKYSVQANFTWSMLGFPQGAKAKVRDIWSKQDQGQFSDFYVADVPSHDVVFLRLALLHDMTFATAVAVLV